MILVPIEHAQIDASEILPGLWQGSHVDHEPSVAKLVGFDAHVCCAYQQHPGETPEGWRLRERDDFKELLALFDDSPWPTPKELQIALKAGRLVAQWVEKGMKVLITCREGRNRSGLVVGIAISKMLRCPANEIVQLIRYQRPRIPGQRGEALTNSAFVSALENLRWH